MHAAARPGEELANGQDELREQGQMDGTNSRSKKLRREQFVLFVLFVRVFVVVSFWPLGKEVPEAGLFTWPVSCF